MNRNFRTVSALLRQDWLIEASYAQAHEQLINAYLSGQLTDVDEEDKKPVGYFLSGFQRTKQTGQKTISGTLQRLGISGLLSFAGSSQAGQGHSIVRHEIASDTPLPPNSVFVLDVRGAIMKESSCFSYGTEDYTQLLNAAYANPNVIGAILLMDSPGGQLSGTPSFYDAVRNPIKPTGVLINEGMIASAAYWIACGADFIYASQKSDSVGSIGVFVRLRDARQAMENAGIKSWEVYSDRSPEKNLPVREALDGKPELLKAELNKAADLFRAAVEAGRGDKLKPATDKVDVFKGAMFSADEAIDLGLIDGFGDLYSAIDKIYELADASKSPSAPSPAASNPSTDFSAQSTAPAASGQTEDITPVAEGLATDSNSNPQTQNDMFGDKHKKLSALAGQEASAITDEALNAINADLDTQNITGVRVISAAYLQEAEQAIANLATANGKITTLEGSITNLTKERDDARAEAAKFGSQPGHLGSKSPKAEEKTVEGQQAEDPFFSETDAEAARLRAQMKAMQ